MTSIPARRLLVYAAVAAVVLAVGVAGVISLRGGAGGAATAVMIETTGMSAGSVPGGSPDEGSAASPSSTGTTEAASIFVQVTGEVRRPGVYEVGADSRAFQAVMEAGGFTEQADEEAVPLAERLTDGCRVHVPAVGAAEGGSTTSESDPTPGGVFPAADPGTSAGGSSSGVVALNSATLAELDSLPGIGPALAQQIVSFREANGPFTSVEQLTDVPGIGPAKLEQLRPLVRL